MSAATAMMTVDSPASAEPMFPSGMASGKNGKEHDKRMACLPEGWLQ
jgi:hypothetical protein